jgi:PAS domain S-box-containing protein
MNAPQRPEPDEQAVAVTGGEPGRVVTGHALGLRDDGTERPFRDTADTAPVLIWTSGADGRCDWFNAGWLAFTGRALEEEVEKGWGDGVHPDDLQRCLDTHLEGLQARRPFTMEYRRRRHDGEYRWLLANGVPRFAADGTFRGFIGSCVDVTEQRAARETLDAANAQLQEQGLELELSNQQLQDQAAELEARAEELQAALDALRERSREAERAREEAEEASRRLAFLAEASERLSRSLDVETTIREIVSLAVPRIADWAAYNVDAGDGTVRTVAIHHPDPAMEALALEIGARYPIRRDDPVGVARVIRTGEPELIPDIPDAVLDAVAHDAEHLAMLRGIGFRSVMNVPLVAGGRVLGALGFGTGAERRGLDAADLVFAQELARRAAIALDHARLYADAQAARAQAEAERARSEAILDGMADGFFALDADFRFVAANRAMEERSGVARGGLLGRTLWELFPGSVGTEFEHHYRRVATERRQAHFTHDHADSRLDLVLEVNAYPAADGGIAVFWRDVTARVRAEAALRVSETRLRDVFEQAPVAVAVLAGPEHVYTVMSPRYASFVPVGRAALGRPFREAVPEIEGQGVAELMDRVFHTGEPFFAHEQLVRLDRDHDGTPEEYYFDIGYQPLRDAAGRVYAIASVSLDVTQHVLARRELEEARQAAEEANRAKAEFLSTMSHELRTPLNAIAGYTELLMLGLRGPVSEAQQQDLERVRRANQYLMGLISDILNFARLDAGQVEFHVGEVRLGPIVADLEALVGPQLAAKSLAFDHDACAPDTPDQPHVVRADPEKLRQILLNLLTNAIKFTDAGGRVSLACEDDAAAGVVRVRVSDTGHGIADEELERVFEPFVQVDRRRTHDSQQGVGLGLAISRDLARAMGGSLTAESTVGEGSTFTLTLPRA